MGIGPGCSGRGPRVMVTDGVPGVGWTGFLGRVFGVAGRTRLRRRVGRPLIGAGPSWVGHHGQNFGGFAVADDDEGNRDGGRNV